MAASKSKAPARLQPREGLGLSSLESRRDPGTGGAKKAARLRMLGCGRMDPTRAVTAISCFTFRMVLNCHYRGAGMGG